MHKSNWNYPTTVWFGEGRIKDLHLACSQLKIKKPLFVTDTGLAQSEMVKEIVKDLNNKFFSTSIFSKVRGNPIGLNVSEGVEEFKKGDVKNDAIAEKIQNYGQNIFNNVVIELKEYI